MAPTDVRVRWTDRESAVPTWTPTKAAGVSRYVESENTSIPSSVLGQPRQHLATVLDDEGWTDAMACKQASKFANGVCDHLPRYLTYLNLRFVCLLRGVVGSHPKKGTSPDLKP